MFTSFDKRIKQTLCISTFGTLVAIRETTCLKKQITHCQASPSTLEIKKHPHRNNTSPTVFDGCQLTALKISYQFFTRFPRK